MRDTAPRVSGLRVALLIGSDGPGGAERVVVQLATTLRARGAHAVVFVPRDGEGWIAQELAGSGTAVEHFHIERPLSLRSARALARSLRAHRIDVAHGHEFAMAVYGAWASRLTGIPHVMTMHGGRYYAERLRRRCALRAAVSASASTVSVSSAFADTLCRDLAIRRSRLVTIPNGIRYERPQHLTLREELRLGPESRLVTAIGNLYAVKGHEHLIEAVARLAARHPTLHLAIAGRGALERMLSAQAARLNLAHRVHLLGLRRDVAAVLEASDVFALPSLSEALPVALLEAMFAARPVVATDVGDVRAVLCDGAAGVVVPVADPAAMAGALDALLSDPQGARALGTAAAAHAQREYDASRMVERYLNLYNSARARRFGHGRAAPSALEPDAVLSQRSRW